MKEIGGYLEIEFPKCGGPAFLPDSTRLNSGRNCFEYLLIDRDITKVHIPFYTCSVILEPVKKLGIEFEFYHLDRNLEPTMYPSLSEGEALLVNNYFGIKGELIEEIAGRNFKNVFVDNSQALFADPVEGVPSFYSLRKFVGAPDGAFLVANIRGRELPRADSSQRVAHLYRRKDISASAGYDLFKAADESLANLPLQRMSHSTEALVESYDFEMNRNIRNRNFSYLHERLGEFNGIHINIDRVSGPLCYPFLISMPNLKQRLIENRIYVPTFWPNVIGWLGGEDRFERELVENLLPLPIDQRISLEDLEFMLELISNEL